MDVIERTVVSDKEAFSSSLILLIVILKSVEENRGE